MANLIQAFAAYCPRIDLQAAATPKRFMELITQRSTLSNGVVKNLQESEIETLIGLLQEGRPVHTGIAIFTPSVDREGNLNINVRVDKRIRSALNAPGGFSGKINNSANIGKSTEEFTERWNLEHPDDPITPEPGTQS